MAGAWQRPARAGLRALLLSATCLALLPSLPARAEQPLPQPRISEWQLPAQMFARSVHTAPDGAVYMAVPNDNKILRFDPRSNAYREWEMPQGHMPNSVIVDRAGTLWTAGFGNGTIGRIRPATGMIAEFAVPSGGGGPHSLALSEDGETIWFTMQTGDKIGSLDTATGRIAELDSSGSPTGITLDLEGNVWWCRSADNKLGRLEPRTGRLSEIDLGRGSRPRRIATAADGSLWVTLYGKGQFVRISPQTAKVVKTYTITGGNAGAHAIAADDKGIVWISQLKADTILRFDATTETMKPVVLPARNYGIRKLAVDAAGRLWYAGAQNGRVGFIE